MTLTTGAVILLRAALNYPGWTKGIGDVYLGGKLLFEKIPDVKEPDVALPDAEKQALINTPLSLDFTGVELDAIKKAIANVPGDKMPLSPSSYEMLKAFEVTG